MHKENMKFIKKNPKIFILTGKAQSGKNKVSEIIKKNYQEKKLKVISLAYASYLKEYIKNITNWDGSEETKPREMLQQLGIELIKNKIKENLLIERIIDDIKVYSYFFDIIIITDARFIEEIEEIKKISNNTTVINIQGKANNLTETEKEHITETALDNYNLYDFKINNNSSIKELEQEVKKIIEVIKW